MSSSQTTMDHETIQRWAEERQGHPATVKGTHAEGEAGVLRIDFEEAEPDERLEAISWDEFFKKFDEAHLAFLYQEQTSGGQQSRFFKLVSAGGHS